MARNASLAILLWLFSACVPTFVFSDYHLFQLTMVVVYAIAILGLAILTGFNGQISLGHGAFYAIGAYVTAILMYQYGWPYWATLPISAIICAGSTSGRSSAAACWSRARASRRPNWWNSWS